MLKNVKTTLTCINKDQLFKIAIEKLTIDTHLDYEEKVYILACAILLLRHYQKDNRFSSYADLAYYIFLKYSLIHDDYMPLYDFSANFGFYPITKTILIDDKVPERSSLISDCFMDVKLDRFKKENSHIETLEQYVYSKEFLEDESNEKSYLAPTSFGKSTLIVECVKKLSKDLKIVIVVPTKSLLVQTYHMIREASLGRKIIIHDEMYNDEASFVAIFTQERSLRLLSRKNIYFDVLFIDEAHNILKKDSRSILLSRLIAKNRRLNPEQKVIYLSPLIRDAENLKISKDQKISPHAINFNIKEADVFEYRLNKEVYRYNRFVNKFYKIAEGKEKFDYLKSNSKEKNFIYNYRPIKIEKLAKDLCEKLPLIHMTDKIKELERILKKEVHGDFYAVKCLKYGLIYLHGKMPDLIKEYLEYNYKKIPELKYVIANSVILEGMNLPIDTLFIFNVLSLCGKDLMNLIGRVNRLNNIFAKDKRDLGKLLPKVHFINDEEHYRSNSKMQNKIELLRSRIFEDKVENPILVSFDIEKIKLPKNKKEEHEQKVKVLQDNEKYIHNHPDAEIDKIKAYLIESGIYEYYGDVNELSNKFLERLNSIKNNQVLNWKSEPMMGKIAHLFIKDIDDISDFEVKRLDYKETRNYYENHILVARKRSLNENISSEFKYFKKRAGSEDSKLYFGVAYGEVPYESNYYSRSSNNAYVDLATKSDEELINLAIVKLKMEEDFISFKLNKFIVMMLDYELITNDEYNLYIYGTTDTKKINLTKYGLSISLISRLEKAGQIDNLYFDQFNNLKGNSDFELFLHSVDDFYKFEINRYLH